MVEAKIRSGLIGMFLGIACTAFFSPVIMQSLFAAECADMETYLRMEQQLEKEQINSRTMQAKLIKMTINFQSAQSDNTLVDDNKNFAVIPKKSYVETVEYVRPEISRPGVIILGMHRSGESVLIYMNSARFRACCLLCHCRLVT